MSANNTNAAAGPSTATPAPTPAPVALTNPLLLPEALGFSPQLLLDDIIAAANASIIDGVNGMEAYLKKWADERHAMDWDSTQEVEQGLVAFQTLLEHHTDLAFDSFEMWSLRNVFAVPPDLPIVLPHHEGLDLTATPRQEKDLMNDIDDLREQIREHRMLKRELVKSLRLAKAKKAVVDKRLEHLQILDTPAIQNLSSVPSKLLELYTVASQLPELDPETPASLAQLQLNDPGKRKWETSKVGYLDWAVEQLLATQDDTDAGRRELRVGSADQLKQMLNAFKLADGVRKSLGGADRMDTT